MKELLISVIITNFNGKKFLPDCLASLMRQTYKNLEIIVVDNASTDDSVTYIKKNYPDVIVTHNKENFGYAEGNNIGFKKSKGEYIVILNNDVKLQPNLIESLHKAFASRPQLGAVQPMVRLMNDPDNLDACGSFWTNTGFNYHYGIYKNYHNQIYSKPFKVYSLKGMCMMIPRKLIETVGLFDSDFWCYFEETDFCHRVWLAGYECWYVPDAFMYHYMSGTRVKKSEAFIQFHSFKNRWCSYIKNLGIQEFLTVVPIYLILNVIFSIIYLLKGRFNECLSIYKAMWWNAENIQQTLKKRNQIQTKIRKKSDNEIFAVVRRNPKLSYYWYLLSHLKFYKDEKVV